MEVKINSTAIFWFDDRCYFAQPTFVIMCNFVYVSSRENISFDGGNGFKIFFVCLWSGFAFEAHINDTSLIIHFYYHFKVSIFSTARMFGYISNNNKKNIRNDNQRISPQLNCLGNILLYG
ncbi:hypothetical protein DAI18_06850 [Microvirgula aerodenitrificans]|uniref:Uncharacterized protein n=1 Tax=Microvirgula aerodenitrificans TaxID=57480 RepID=A0A2S0P8X3_9NEIS|nr:hypothetical protein DAI18_06850 [Microvirgula aerodenitrificans]